MPRRLGQHFLADASWRARIARSLRPQADEVWLEIGAGHGELTLELARHAKRVLAIELDPPLVDRLRQLAVEHPNIEVLAGDILALDLPELPATERFRVYGSLPYYITSPILRRLFESADAIESIHIVIQREVAERIVAQPGRRNYGFLSVLAQYYTQPEIAFRIPPGAFRPPPKVESALVRMPVRRDRALAAAEEAAFLTFVGECFEQKRKTLLNNLKSVLGRDRAESLLHQQGLRNDVRAEQLTFEQFLALFKSL